MSRKARAKLWVDYMYTYLYNVYRVKFQYYIGFQST